MTTTVSTSLRPFHYFDRFIQLPTTVISVFQSTYYLMCFALTTPRTAKKTAAPSQRRGRVEVELPSQERWSESEAERETEEEAVCR
jgi:hypothetical protein